MFLGFNGTVGAPTLSQPNYVKFPQDRYLHSSFEKKAFIFLGPDLSRRSKLDPTLKWHFWGLMGTWGDPHPMLTSFGQILSGSRSPQQFGKKASSFFVQGFNQARFSFQCSLVIHLCPGVVGHWMCRGLPTNLTNRHMDPMGFETRSSSFAGRRLTTGPRCPADQDLLQKTKIRPRPQVKFLGSNGNAWEFPPYANQFWSNFFRIGISTAIWKKKASSSQAWTCSKTPKLDPLLNGDLGRPC